MEGRITTPTKSETHSCPECGVEFEATEPLHDHFFDEHLVTQPEDENDAETTLPEESHETSSSVQREGGDAIEWPVQQAATETPERSVRQESTEPTGSTGWSALLAQVRDVGLSPRPGKLADVLVALLALVLAGIVGAVLLFVAVQVAL